MPTEGFYDERLVVHVTGPVAGAEMSPGASVDATVQLVGTVAGPAGSSLVELPGGVTWEVDHAAPGELVQIGVDAWTGDRSHVATDLLERLIGDDRARRVARVLAEGPSDRPRRLAGTTPDQWVGSQRRRSEFARAAGRLVAVADLAADPDLTPLARVAAAAEWLGEVRSGGRGTDILGAAARDVWWSMVADVGRVDDAEVEGLADADPSATRRLVAMLREVADGDSDVEGLADRLDRSVLVDLALRPAASGPDSLAALAEPMGDAAGAPPEPQLRRAMLGADTDRPQVTFVRPGLLHVGAMRSDTLRWVRVLRADGLVTLAVAPFRRDGLLDLAEALVPPDLGTREIVVEVVDAPMAVRAGAGAVRDAVRSGRDAAMLGRLGHPVRSAVAWRECAELWDAAGDASRAGIARQYARGGVEGGRSFLADEITEALGDV